MKMINLVVFAFLNLLVADVAAQGCSDAGFCTAGAMKGGGSVADSGSMSSRIGISLSAGAGENGTAIITPQLEAGIAIGKKAELELKVPFSGANGNLGSHSGIGDIICTYTRQWSLTGTWKINGTVGGRISTGNANACDDNGSPLPMPYQSNLGTADLIAGVGAAYGRHISFSAGYQQPLVQYNDNGYLPAIIYPAMPGAYDYFASAKLRRRGDVLLRMDGHYKWKRFGIVAGPLLIDHLGMDKITTATNTQISLRGSDGITLNLAGSLAYNGDRYKVDLSGGTPFIVRDYRPDGLTRAWVITLRLTRVL